MTQNKLICSKVAFTKYLTPDYFLPSSHSESYYSRKYSGSTNFSNHKSFRSRIKQVATVSLIFLSMVTGEVFAGDKKPKSKAKPSRKQEVTFESTHLSNNLPDVVPQLPLPDLIPSNPPVTPPPPPPMPPLPDIVPQFPLPDVVQVSLTPPAPPMAPSMPDLLSDAGSSKSNKKSALFDSIRNFKKHFKLKKVKEEPKPQVISSDTADFMSQVLARREAIAGEKKNNKFKKAAKQVIVLNAEEERAREAEIAKKIAENKERAATLRKQKGPEWEANRKKVLAEVEVETQKRAAEAAKAIREQKARENGGDSSTVIAGIDPILHKNMVADLRQEISSLKEQLTLNSHVTSEGINSVESVNSIRSKRSLEDSKIVETKDQSTSTEDLSVLEDRLFDKKAEILRLNEDEAVRKLDEVISSYSDSDSGYNESLEGSSDISSINGSDANDLVSKIVSQSNSIVSETVQDELADVEKELQSQKLKEKEEVEAVEDILSEDSMTVEPEDLITDTVAPEDTHNSTAGHQEALAKRASIIAKARADLSFGSKAVSKQIRHRLLTRDIGKLVAVSAGDEEESQAQSYSVWSSGVFGGSKQKDSSNIIGHSSKIHGGTIGGEINLSSDLMFGVSYSRLSSKFKYPSMLDANQNVSRTNTNIFSIYSSSTLAANTNLQTLASVALSSKNGKKQDIFKPKSKLFSFESHLNRKITFQNNITLIPSIGFRYEYGRIGASKKQILDSYIVHHKRSKNSTLSGEVGTRVLFTPINLSSNFKLIPTVHISLEKRIVGRGAKSGQLLSVKDIGESSSVSFISNSNQEKLITNIGGGLIASHKNMSLEFLYDLQKQRSFKSHQGVLKLKVNL
ncbi:MULTISPECIES: autotransporter outer membrane beta-barrel domain-containing protein [spotted fever group]|uniref:Autotransporter beta-domain protein n=1 Tax=Rickettsia tamurae subsp. buchneri TaxID=1462938 RepID=A0A8E1BZ82_9RICK|nr:MULTISPECIES: autotransporter outer membrane beta-barrel domain-containing protein [spotted fever group]EER20749.1 cell surface antigen Sca12 [Rickettsia endosymbiont of Ixodes scapularis]KDO02106.1 Autotransporter beta-domain protein [Rickettsia tamurae subsp. buchneri]